ncbi:probable G-protein coupled receptor 21 [Nematostella vectensis]|uniref:probable G-protein coupled receptor 21 n=1 Tax=Nematostella vectensis TaxID=45351 RepID=UPI002077263E|nr:probable G-protein coupled receptor 21 [Nematostella vectensis]
MSSTPTVDPAIVPTTSHVTRDQAFYLTKVISYIAVSVLIIAGNLLCLVVFLRTPQMRRKRAYYLLVSLSIADALVGISLVEKIIVMTYYGVAEENNNTASVINFLASPASIYTLATISIERFIVTVFPLYYRSSGKSLYVAMIGIPWACAVVVVTLYILAVNARALPPVVVTYTRITIPVSLLIIFICCTALTVKLKYGSRVLSVSSRQILRDRKLAITLLIVTLLSLITWVPFGVYVTVLYYCMDCKKETYARDLYLALNWLRFLNSGINVVIYMFRMPEFKRGVARITPSLYRQQNLPAETGTRSCTEGSELQIEASARKTFASNSSSRNVAGSCD